MEDKLREKIRTILYRNNKEDAAESILAQVAEAVKQIENPKSRGEKANPEIVKEREE